MTTKIEGTTNRDGGQGFAHENYKVIIPAIAKEYPAVKDFGTRGTINIDSLRPPLRKSFADYWSSRIRWEPVAGKDELGAVRNERYGIIKIQFEYPLGGALFDGWIIMPEGHGWSYDENGGVEIVAEEIPNLQRGVDCAIYIVHRPAADRPADFGAQFNRAGYLVENSSSVPR